MLKKYVHLLGWVWFLHRETKKKKEIEGSLSLGLSIQEMELKVRVVHAGRIVELYEGAIPAALVLGKYPGMCVARPEVFNRPHESLLRPDEVMMPGHKFYLVPQTTVKKLRRKHPQMKSQVEAETENKEWKVLNGDKVIAGEECGCDHVSSFCSAKDFYVSREKWSRCFQRRICIEGKAFTSPAKAFTPPIKKVRMWPALRWEPSLISVKEDSP